MAGAYVSLVMLAVRGLEASAKLTLVALADCANIKDAGVMYPAVLTLCARVGVADRRHMQRILRDLEIDGWISVEQASKGGSGRTTRYRLNLPLLRAKAHENSGAQTADKGDANGGPQTADNSGAQTADAPVDNSNNRGPQTAPTAVHEAINRGPQTARSLEPELINKPSAPISLANLMREALKGNGNRKPLESGKEEGQPEKSQLRTVGVSPPGMTQSEQVAFVEAQLAKGRR